MSQTHALIWFNLFVAVMLALDLGIFQRKAHVVRLPEAALWSGIWVAISLAFNALVWFWYGSEAGVEFFTAYVLEKSLAVDNLAVFAIIFTALAVGNELQHRVLFWGIVAALPMRAIFIVAGVELLSRFDWILYVFGAFLLITGIRLWSHKDAPIDRQNNAMIRVVRKFLPVTNQYSGTSFFVRDSKRWLATPLLVALLLVETADLVFALDSIPAVLTVTRKMFIAYTSNALAILGLRSMYFVLAGAMAKLRYLHHALCLVIILLGVEMLSSHFYLVRTVYSLLAILIIIGGATVASLVTRPRSKNAT